jgi:hypothetical protein
VRGLGRELRDGAEDLVGVDDRIDLGPHARDLAVGADEEGHPRGHDQPGNVVGVLGGLRGVRHHHERQLELLAELLVAGLVVTRYAEDGNARLVELVPGVAERAGLLRAPRRVVLRIEVDDGELPLVRRQLDRRALGVLPLEVGSDRPDWEQIVAGARGASPDEEADDECRGNAQQ